MGAQSALVSRGVDPVTVGLDGAGAQELRPLAREQRAILEQVDPDEAVRDEDRGAPCAPGTIFAPIAASTSFW